MAKKPNIPAPTPSASPQPRHRDDLGRNALVNLLENIDGAQTMKDAGKPQEEVIGYVERAVQRAIAEHNGGKKTIDASVAGHVLGNR